MRAEELLRLYAGMTNDVSLFLGLATATATALGAAVALDLLRFGQSAPEETQPKQPKQPKQGWRRGLATIVLVMAVLGIGAALIAVAKGHSTSLLTWLMFVGLSAPALFALFRSFDRILERNRIVWIAWLLSIAGIGALLAITSPDFFRNLFSPDTDEDVVTLQAADASDPNKSGCSPTGADIPNSRAVIRDGDHYLGAIYLRYSIACKTIWARVDGLPSRLPRAMHFVLTSGRRRLHKKRDAVTFNYDLTNQLVVGTSCVQGSFYYGSGKERLAYTNTPCVTIDKPAELKRNPVIPEPPGAAPPDGFPEQQGAFGIGTHANPHRPQENGPIVAPYQRVEVSCKVWTQHVKAAQPDGYMYRIATAPWSNDYYAPASSFWNGDRPGRKVLHDTDWSVPDCGEG